MPQLNILRMTQQFASPTATIAMRIPYSYEYQRAFLDRLRKANPAWVAIDTLYTTTTGRDIQVIRIEEAEQTGDPTAHATILVIAREHGTEPASSWVAHGMIQRLLADDAQALRHNTTWLIVPILDPESVDAAIFAGYVESFGRGYTETTPEEVYEYAKYCADYVNAGKTIDIAITLHNVETNECPNLFCPFIDFSKKAATLQLNQPLFAAFQQHAYLVGDYQQPWDVGLMQARLPGWCALYYGSLDLDYEVNDRFPGNRLPLAQLQQMGAIMVQEISRYLRSEEGQRWHRMCRETLATRDAERQEYFTRNDITRRTKQQVLSLGY